MRTLIIKESGNKKTGPIPTTYSERKTCPPSCAHPQASALSRADQPMTPTCMHGVLPQSLQTKVDDKHLKHSQAHHKP